MPARLAGYTPQNSMSSKLSGILCPLAFCAVTFLVKVCLFVGNIVNESSFERIAKLDSFYSTDAIMSRMFFSIIVFSIIIRGPCTGTDAVTTAPGGVGVKFAVFDLPTSSSSTDFGVKTNQTSPKLSFKEQLAHSGNSSFENWNPLDMFWGVHLNVLPQF